MLKQWAIGLLLASVLTACDGQNNNAASSTSAAQNGAKIELLNVSYDVMRDFYKDFNPLFIKDYQAKNPNISIDIKQSHGGSSKQALSVANGLTADVVTMNQTSDIELLQKKQLVAEDWQRSFANNAVPFTSITVFLVHKGNPKGVHDWNDLAKDGVKLVIANPKTAGNGRYTFLAAYANALKENGNNQDAAKTFAQKFLKNVEVFEAGGRGATTTFAQRNIGDVLITFENEAHVILQQFGADKFEIVYPKYTIAAENPVAVVTSVTDKKGTTEAAKAYLDYLWSDDAQNLAANFYLRPSKTEVLAKHNDRFPQVETFRANDVFGSWDDIMQTYFADGGVFDQVNKR
ncbi:sulfate ABC transporter substrate-binding protein [Wielerella bovis]|uniref:sulfate ABC transporter substrate-binding protein n=1 Tax=Wielerella bovis TaxID=2917790 RepID=UPI002018CF34|nr:sulfate ABC transporter substrate-binding protein [Wielerella bovis]ULJ60854.1 sulfate ABC transporter substrate-binding protein [Wielerella bovis]